MLRPRRHLPSSCPRSADRQRGRHPRRPGAFHRPELIPEAHAMAIRGSVRGRKVLVMSEPFWEPDADTVSDTNLARFMADHGIGEFDELLARSTAEPEWFWGAVVDFLGIPFDTPWEQVLDVSDGIPWARWFTGGRTNLADACVDR